LTYSRSQYLLIYILLLLSFVLVPPATFPSELVWNCGSYSQSVGLLGRGIIPVARPLPTQDNTNTEEMRGFESTLPVFEKAKICHALDCAVAVITTYKTKYNKTRGRGNMFACRTQSKLTYLLTYGAEPFLRSCQLCSHSRTSQHFMEPEDSSPCSEEHSTGPYPEPDRSSPHHSILSL
jgi:hypothetical protein